MMHSYNLPLEKVPITFNSWSNFKVPVPIALTWTQTFIITNYWHWKSIVNILLVNNLQLIVSFIILVTYLSINNLQ